MHEDGFVEAHPGTAMRFATMDGQRLLIDGGRGTVRPLVPPTLRREVVDRFHRQAHPGVKATRRAMDA